MSEQNGTNALGDKIEQGGVANLEKAKRVAAARKQRFQLVPFVQLKPSTAPDYLVKGLIPRVGLTVIWGPPKSGKSFIISDLMMSVALGWEFRERKVIQGAVVYCAFEGADGFGKRAEAFRQHHGLAEDLYVPFYLVSARMDFIKDHAELLAAIRLVLGNIKPVAVVLDTLHRSLAGSESNDEDMAKYVKAVDALREELNCAVVVAHHCGIDASRPRGHSSLTGAVDAQLAIKRASANHIVLKVERMKDGPEGDTLLSRLQVVMVGLDEDGDPITSCVVLPVDSEPLRATAARPTARLSKAAQIALLALEDALHHVRAAGPTSAHMPAETHIVTKSQWRQFAYRRGISSSKKERAQQQAFQRASEQLIGRGMVSARGEQVWRTD